jgi:hypothetical protein
MDLNRRFPKYRKLLYLYPAGYRQHYSEQMVQTLADMLDDAPTVKAKLAVWTRTMLDLPLSAARQQVSYTGATMTNDTPKYVKNSAIIGAALLVPFFILITAHSLDSSMQNSVFWHFRVIFTFFVLLPSIAFLLTTVALISWLVERHKQEKKSWFSELFDLRRNWHLLAVLVVGLGIVGLVYEHDSMQCVTGNPVREAGQMHRTLRCIEQGGYAITTPVTRSASRGN